METPSSTRRVTRSQTLALAGSASASNNNIIPRKIEDSEKGILKSKQDRSALIDITNDSPIIGLATGGLETPSSAIAKKRSSRAKNSYNNNIKTPGSGEILLRGQVKTLLQKVEEEAELSKLPLESRPFLHLQGFVNSPMHLLAPTPANTPQLLNLSEDQNDSVLPSPIAQLQSISQVVSNIFEGKEQQKIDSEKNVITRSLLMDFSEKSSESCPDEDESSVWSIQVNASAHDDEEEEEKEEEEEEEEVCCDFNYEEEYNNEELFDELCEEMSRICMDNEKIITGKHTRFIYNSDDEIIEECVEKKDSEPKGKHLHFDIEEEDENGDDN